MCPGATHKPGDTKAAEVVLRSLVAMTWAIRGKARTGIVRGGNWLVDYHPGVKIAIKLVSLWSRANNTSL